MEPKLATQQALSAVFVDSILPSRVVTLLLNVLTDDVMPHQPKSPKGQSILREYSPQLGTEKADPTSATSEMNATAESHRTRSAGEANREPASNPNPCAAQSDRQGKQGRRRARLAWVRGTSNMRGLVLTDEDKEMPELPGNGTSAGMEKRPGQC